MKKCLQEKITIIHLVLSTVRYTLLVILMYIVAKYPLLPNNVCNFQGPLRRAGPVEPRGEKTPTPGDAEIQDGARDTRASARRSVQRGVQRVTQAVAHTASRQETLQDRNTATRHLLHRLPQPRARRLDQSLASPHTRTQ